MLDRLITYAVNRGALTSYVRALSDITARANSLLGRLRLLL